MSLSLIKKLAIVQHKLKAPKTQYSKFGDFYFRSAEDILEAAKPLLAEVGAILILGDELVQIGERYYVRATAAIYDTDTDAAPLTASAYSREQASKAKFDESQLTGSASSYARKYALNALLCLDDNKDADALNDASKAHEAQRGHIPPKAPAQAAQSPGGEPWPPPPLSDPLPPDVCPSCQRKQPPAFSQKQKRELSGAEILAYYGGVCRECAASPQ